MRRAHDIPGGLGAARLVGRGALIALACAYLGLFLVLPLLTVFVQAL
ncbi:MAG: hypothetical protein RL684_2120, partial [Pseudomonadota bacterium]